MDFETQITQKGLVLPMGILIALVLFINEFPDYFADSSAGKRTLFDELTIIGE